MLLEKKANGKSVLVRYIQNRVKAQSNKNFIIVFIGATGSGKSYAALKLGELVDPTFDISRVGFKAKEFLDVVNKIVADSEKGIKTRGKAVMWDEMGVEHSAKEFMSISNRIVNHFFQTSRHLNLIMIMTVPLFSFIDSSTRKLVHGIATMKKIDFIKKVSKVGIKIIQVDVMTGKVYPKYLRVVNQGVIKKIKNFSFPLPSEKLLRNYEQGKKDFTTNLNINITEKLKKHDKDSNFTGQRKSLSEQDRKIMIALANTDATDKQKVIAKEFKRSQGFISARKTASEKKGYSLEEFKQNKEIKEDIVEKSDETPKEIGLSPIIS